MKFTDEEKIRMKAVVKETVKYFSDPERFGYDPDSETCQYYDSKSGNMCAVGRCMVDPTEFGDTELPLEALAELRAGDLDSLLRSEYKGLSFHFWDMLQSVHDAAATDGVELKMDDASVIELLQWIDGDPGDIE